MYKRIQVQRRRLRTMKSSEGLGARAAIIETLFSLTKQDEYLSTLNLSDVEKIVDLIIDLDIEPNPQSIRKKLQTLILDIAERA
jgi:hypothetical protein